ARDHGLPVFQHTEDHALTQGADMHEGAVATRLGLRGAPRVAEDAAVARDLLLAEYTGSRYHAAHISTLGALEALTRAKERRVAATCAVGIHHLVLDDSALADYDPNLKLVPPLREARDVAALRA